MDKQQRQENYTLEDALDATVVERGSALEALHGADLQRQALAARQNPRGGVRAFRDRLVEYATLDEHVAGTCIYSLPRGGKRITGPSVRFAEIVQASWGNLHVTCTLISLDAEAAVVRGRALDLETNSSLEIDVRRRVLKRRGTRPGQRDEDAEQLAVAVATSLARRNVILAVVPRSLWETGFTAAADAATGKGTMAARRQAAMAMYAQLGATEEQILAHIEREGIEEITQDDLRHLRGMVTAIRAGDLTIEQAMRPPEAQSTGPVRGGSGGESPLAQRLAVADSTPSSTPADEGSEGGAA